MLRIAVLGSTRGTDLQAIIDAIESGKLTDVEISVVISNKEKAYILERARKHEIKALFIDPKAKEREDYDREIMKVLDKEKIDLILLIGYMKIITPPLVEAYRNKIMNVHPSLLPAFAAGMDKSVHEEVLKSGVKTTGCTIHFIDEGTDTGPIILQKECKIEEDETADSLKEKVQKLEGEAFIEAIKLFREGKLKVEGHKVIISQ